MEQLLLALSIAIVSAGAPLLSQYMSNRSALKLKRLELVYQHRVVAYQELLRCAAAFAHDPRNEDVYEPYLAALVSTRTVASRSVAAMLKGDPSSLDYQTQVVRQLAFQPGKESFSLASSAISTGFHDALERVTDAMREDLQSLSD